MLQFGKTGFGPHFKTIKKWGHSFKTGIPILNRAGRQIYFKMGSPHLKIELVVNQGLTYMDNLLVTLALSLLDVLGKSYAIVC